MRDSVARILQLEYGSIEYATMKRGCHPSAIVEMRDLRLEKDVSALTPFARNITFCDKKLGKKEDKVQMLCDPWYVSVCISYHSWSGTSNRNKTICISLSEKEIDSIEGDPSLPTSQESLLERTNESIAPRTKVLIITHSERNVAWVCDESIVVLPTRPYNQRPFRYRYQLKTG